MADEVGADRPFMRLDRDVDELADGPDADIAEPKVDRSAKIARRLGKLPHRLRLREVERDGQHPRAGPPSPFRPAFPRLTIPPRPNQLSPQTPPRTSKRRR